MALQKHLTFEGFENMLACGLTCICLRCLEKVNTYVLPNGGLMVMNPMVQSVKNQLKNKSNTKNASDHQDDILFIGDCRRFPLN